MFALLLLSPLFISTSFAADFSLHVANPPVSSYQNFYYDYSQQEEVHPYDEPDRRPGSHRPSFRSRYNYRSDPYYRRTVTHALHPYYRNHYHDILTVDDTSRDAEVFREAYISNFPNQYIPTPTRCSEYGFYKGHGRLPPVDFECFRP